MSLQDQFTDFNNTIHMDYDKRSGLAEKRDGLVKTLSSSGQLPAFDVYNQGSYAMYTGVEPIEKGDIKQEYDIDIGFIFNVNKDDVDAFEYKGIICDLIDGRTDYGADIKKPCVTLTYKKDGEKGYHADLVVYAYQDKNDTNSQLYLARGKSKDDPEKCWEKADPKGLVDYINNKISDSEDRDQCRRVIRYLKRWKSLKFGKDHAQPASIGITLLAFDNFTAHKDDDLSALIDVVTVMKSKFYFYGADKDGNSQYKISYSLPTSLKVESGSNLFSKMSDAQMTTFKEKTDKLLDDLNAVEGETDLLEQCKKLNKIFGDDFKIPTKQDVSKSQKSYIPFSSSSGVRK